MLFISILTIYYIKIFYTTFPNIIQLYYYLFFLKIQLSNLLYFKYNILIYIYILSYYHK